MPYFVKTLLFSRVQYPPVSDSWSRSDATVWAGIASFRDKRCGQTLFNMFSKAAHPERVTAGVVQQNEEGDPSCLERYCELMLEHKVFVSLMLFCLGGGDPSVLACPCVRVCVCFVFFCWRAV